MHVFADSGKPSYRLPLPRFKEFHNSETLCVLFPSLCTPKEHGGLGNKSLQVQPDSFLSAYICRRHIFIFFFLYDISIAVFCPAGES